LKDYKKEICGWIGWVKYSDAKHFAKLNIKHMGIKAILVDDEKMARVLLRGMLQEYCADVEIVEECHDLPSAVKAIVKHQPELVFLDIEMPGHTGLELLDFFDEKNVNFSIIFTTAYNQYAIQAFKLSAVDYLLKPIDPKELQNAVNRYAKTGHHKPDLKVLQNNFSASDDNFKIAISTLNSIKYLDLKSILVFEADGSYTHILLENGQKITTSKGLKTYEDILTNHSNFMRCQKSYIVNLEKITEYIKSDGGYVVVNNLHKVPVSADKISELIERLKNSIRIL
jgi:two-component system LytT family response regulator